MNRKVEQQVRDFITQNFLYGRPNGFKSSDSLIEKGIIDSTGVLELVSYIEETYGIQVEDDELIPENLDSVENASRFITRKLAREGLGDKYEETISLIVQLEI